MPVVQTQQPPQDFTKYPDKQPLSRFLYPGSRFLGSQTSNNNTYSVEINLLNVNLPESFLCGYLEIKGLADDWPSLCTYFEGQVVGEKYGFLTCKWGASVEIDLQHWQIFHPFQHQHLLTNNIKTKIPGDYLYLRLKELFLVPDHKIKTINGASFSGFYYVCMNKISGEMEGVYYHQSSEMFQKLEIQHVGKRSFDTFEFR